MNRWISIDGRVFYPNRMDIQTTLGDNGFVSISFNYSLYPDIYKYFIDKIDFISGTSKLDKMFTINSFRFNAYGCQIKSIDTNPINNIINVEIITDYFTIKDKQQIRDESIDEILKTENK